MEVPERICKHCEIKNKIRQADGFCVLCEKYMCIKCFVKRKTLTKGHVCVSKVEAGISNCNYMQFCPMHARSTISFFCPKHEQVGCLSCKSRLHKTCIVDFITNQRQSFERIQKAKDLTKVIDGVQVQSTDIASSIKDHKNTCDIIHEKAVLDVYKFSDELHFHIERLTKSMLTKAATLELCEMQTLDCLEKETEAVLMELSSLKSQMNKRDVDVVSHRRKISRLQAHLAGIYRERAVTNSYYSFERDAIRDAIRESSFLKCTAIGNLRERTPDENEKGKKDAKLIDEHFTAVDINTKTEEGAALGMRGTSAKHLNTFKLNSSSSDNDKDPELEVPLPMYVYNRTLKIFPSRRDRYLLLKENGANSCMDSYLDLSYPCPRAVTVLKYLSSEHFTTVDISTKTEGGDALGQMVTSVEPLNTVELNSSSSDNDEVPDFQKLEKVFGNSTLEGASLKVSPLPISNCIIVANLASGVTKDTVECYFENTRKSGGGQVEKVVMNEDDTCLVYFADFTITDRVLERKHTLGGQKLYVKRYPECLGRPEGEIEERILRIPEDVVLKNVDSQKIKPGLYTIESPLECLVLVKDGDNAEKSFDSTYNTVPVDSGVIETIGIKGLKIKGYCKAYDCRNIYTAEGDMTELNVDMIVNSVDDKLSLTGRLGKAIVEKGGREIQKECNDYISRESRLDDGDVFVSTAGSLKADFIVHVRGPVWRGGMNTENEMLSEAVFKCLQQASARNLSSIAIPAISCGTNGYPVLKATSTIVEAVKNFFREVQESTVTDIYLCDMKFNTADIFNESLKNAFGETNFQKYAIKQNDERPHPAPRNPKNHSYGDDFEDNPDTIRPIDTDEEEDDYCYTSISNLASQRDGDDFEGNPDTIRPIDTDEEEDDYYYTSISNLASQRGTKSTSAKPLKTFELNSSCSDNDEVLGSNLKRRVREAGKNKFAKSVDDSVDCDDAVLIARYSESVGSIRFQGQVIGTVFRVGDEYVMTAWHVLKEIMEEILIDCQTTWNLTRGRVTRRLVCFTLCLVWFQAICKGYYDHAQQANV